MQQEINTYSLSQLSTMIASVFRQNFSTKRFWVTAEIIGLKVSRGHCYLQLAEKDEVTTTPKAEFRGIIWASNFQLISKLFLEATGDVLREQIQILCAVEVQYHERYGLSLLVHQIDASYTLGKLELERRKTVERLMKEGIYYLNKDLVLPEVVQRIAIISAEDSKGYEDFLTRLKNNPYQFKFHYKLYTSLLQGDLAASDMIKRLNQIEKENDRLHFDAVIIVRGGGGSSSLNTFNDYSLCKAIASFPIPVITGIGHTTNISIVDEIANVNLITPTEAAVFLMERMAAYANDVENNFATIREYVEDKLNEEKLYIEEARQTFSSLIGSRIVSEKHDFHLLSIRFNHATKNRLALENIVLSSIQEKIKSGFTFWIREQNKDQEKLYEQLFAFCKLRIEKESAWLVHSETKLRLLDPHEILKRGFSYTMVNDQLLQSVDQLSLGNEITTVLSQGTIKSKITKINNG